MSLNISKCFPTRPFFFFLCNKCIVYTAWPNPSLFVWLVKKKKSTFLQCVSHTCSTQETRLMDTADKAMLQQVGKPLRS